MKAGVPVILSLSANIDIEGLPTEAHAKQAEVTKRVNSALGSS